ncbi:uncharacterized protein MEPE_00372 [Melanopsichium pennsylvanicum]|uniref:Uncharacterized protein n=1 Tax=Melanopsichium pennsylvanicum TaxID=63383 RepID=A0AAJ4XG12_9BASI|nr:uncharacterized protein MEPE_00372 [Melanopsichium pennsylvanicum]
MTLIWCSADYGGRRRNGQDRKGRSDSLIEASDLTVISRLSGCEIHTAEVSPVSVAGSQAEKGQAFGHQFNGSELPTLVEEKATSLSPCCQGTKKNTRRFGNSEGLTY